MIVDQVLRAPGQFTIVALAPLTNLAEAIRLCPGIVGAVRNVIIMGGALAVRGNATQYAECNMFNDPVAARVVLSSGIPVTLVPLDVTRSAIVDATVFTSALREFADNPVASFLMEASASFFKPRSAICPDRAAVLHDPLALAIALQPSLVRCEKRRIVVEVAGDHVGQTRMLDADAYEEGAATVEIATTLDESSFTQLTISLLRRAASRMAQCL
jgi:inosine-uridine nucleoside N-ribohydrolase